MRRITRRRRVIARVLGAVAVLAAAAPAARASTAIDIYKVTVPGNQLDVEGATNGLPDNCSDGTCANYTISVKDFANNVQSGVHVWVDLRDCIDIGIPCDQLAASTGQWVDDYSIVNGTTNASGQFTFKIQGFATARATLDVSTSDGTPAGTACAKFYCDNAGLIANLVVHAYDVDGLGSPVGAVNGVDVSLVAAEALKGSLGAVKRARDDYNRDGNVTGADVSRSAAMAVQASLGTGSQSTGTLCP